MAARCSWWSNTLRSRPERLHRGEDARQGGVAGPHLISFSIGPHLMRGIGKDACMTDSACLVHCPDKHFIGRRTQPSAVFAAFSDRRIGREEVGYGLAADEGRLLSTNPPHSETAASAGNCAASVWKWVFTGLAIDRSRPLQTRDGRSADVHVGSKRRSEDAM